MLLRGIFILGVALSFSENEGEWPFNNLPPCKPFRLLFIWQTSSGEDSSFIQQKRLIIDLINNVRNGTEILLTTVDISLKYLIHIKKNSTDDSWVRIIGSFKPGHLRSHIIQHSLISQAVYKFLNQGGNQKRAEEIFFVVNKESAIDNIEKLKERLKYKILFVVFAGMSSPPEVWTTLATDKDHLFVISDRHWESVKPVAEDILIHCFQGNIVLLISLSDSSKMCTVFDGDGLKTLEQECGVFTTGVLSAMRIHSEFTVDVN